MKEFLEKLIAEKRSKLNETLKRMDESNDLNDVKALAAKIDEIKSEIAEIEAQLAKLQEEEPKQEPDNNPEPPKNEDDRSRFNPIATYRNTNGQPVQSRSFGRDSMEYRKAFKDYIQNGAESPLLEKRTNRQSTVADLGVLAPMTIEQEIIKGVEKVYGSLYADVKKTNVKGGVKYPVASFTPTFNRLSETGAPSDRQKVTVSGYVEFGFRLGEVRISQTYINAIQDVEVFERDFTEAMVQAYVKAMDAEIIAGRGSSNNEMEGILIEAAKVSSRITSDHIIEMKAADVADWTKWQSKLFAKLPLGLKKRKAKFVFTNGTWESNLKTLADNNNRPIATDWFNPATGEPVTRFKGHDVTLIESDLAINNVSIKDFDFASDGDYFGMLWVPELAYAINSNEQWSIQKYFDNEKLETVTRGLVVNDGKVLDAGYIFLLKKDV